MGDLQINTLFIAPIALITYALLVYIFRDILASLFWKSVSFSKSVPPYIVLVVNGQLSAKIIHNMHLAQI